MPPAERTRRHHRRSRNGCVSCKARHIRCDEEKPICRNCLKNGGACGYREDQVSGRDSHSASLTVDLLSSVSPDTSANTASSSGLNVIPSQLLARPFPIPLHLGASSHPSQLNMPQPSVSTILGSARTDPFNTLPLELSDVSKMLLDHFARNRILLQNSVQSTRETELFRLVMSDPAMLHGAIFLSASSWMKLGGQRTLVEPTFYQHKSESIRIINERLGDRSTATSDTTVGAIASQVLVETLSGAANTAAVHLDGLKQLVDLRGDLHSRTMNRYVQRLVMIADLLTSSATQTKPRFQETPPPAGREVKTPVSTSTQGNLIYYEEELGLDPEVSKIFVDLHRVSCLMEENDNGTPKVEKAVLSRSISNAEMSVDLLVREGRYDLRTVKGAQSNSMCCVLAAYLYVYYFLRRIPANSNLYDYMVGLLKSDIENIGDTVRHIFPNEVLFWVLFVGALGGKGLPAESWFKQELAVSRKELRITTWEVAKFVLKKFAWVEDWNEEVGKDLFNGLVVLE